MCFFLLDRQVVIPSRVLFLLFLWFSTGIAPLLAQQTPPAKGTLSGILVDVKTRHPLPFATVTAYRTADTTILSYRLTDDAGKFTLQHVPVGVPAYIVVAFSGYKVVRQPFTLTPDSVNGQMDTLALLPDTLTLDEVLIAAERPPVIFRHDTIEFNAESFKTLPSALVEDLLRKLPGVRVDAGGNITVNGQKVSRIMVDGKEFFGSDPKMATRNLSASMIDRVQVSEDKEQRDANPTATADEVGVIVNLTLKRGMKKGWFGKGFSGAGYSAVNPENPYDVGGIANIYRDTLQVSVLGGANNLNRSSLSWDDVMTTGGFRRGGFTGAGDEMGSFSINGVSLGNPDQGVSHTLNGGVNLNYSLGKKLNLNLRYLAGEINNRTEVIGFTEQFLADTTIGVRDTSSKATRRIRQSTGFTLDWKPDTFTSIRFTPSVAWGNDSAGSRRLSSTGRTVGGSTEVLNTYTNGLSTQNTTLSPAAQLRITRKFHKPKREFTLFTMDNLSFTGNDQLFEGAGTVGNVAASTPSQLRQQRQSTLNLWGNMKYQEPLTAKLLMTLTVSATATRNTDTVHTFLENAVNDQYTTPVDSLTNAMRLWYTSVSATSTLIWEVGKGKKTLKIQPSIGVQRVAFNNRFQTGGEVNRGFTSLIPGLRIGNKKFTLNYNYVNENIQAKDLRPVTDYTNPLNPVQGNPNLLPPVKHYFSAHYFNNNPVTSTNLTGGFWGETVNRAVVYAREVTAEGIQITRPVNADGVMNGNVWGSYSFPVKVHDSAQVEVSLGLNGGADRSVLIFNGVQAMPLRYNVSMDAGAEISWRNVFTFNPQYSLAYSQSLFSNAEFPNQQVVWHTLDLSSSLRMPQKFLWETDVEYRYNPNPAPGFRQHNTLLNAGVTFLFLKQERGKLKLYGYDLLNQNQGLTRTTNGNQVVNQSFLVLRRYYMLSFTYDLRPAGEKKKKNNHWWYW